MKLKVNVWLTLLEFVLFAGLTRETTEALVSIVNVQVALAPVFVELSMQLTFQVWVPWAILLIAKSVFVAFSVLLFD